MEFQDSEGWPGTAEVCGRLWVLGLAGECPRLQRDLAETVLLSTLQGICDLLPELAGLWLRGEELLLLMGNIGRSCPHLMDQ